MRRTQAQCAEAIAGPSDLPYTLPEEDPFNIKPLLAQPRRRRSSMLDKWIEEQQISTGPADAEKPELSILPPTTPLPSPSPYCTIGLGAPSASKLTLDGFVVLDDTDLPPEDCDELGSLQVQ